MHVEVFHACAAHKSVHSQQYVEHSIGLLVVVRSYSKIIQSNILHICFKTILSGATCQIQTTEVKAAFQIFFRRHCVVLQYLRKLDLEQYVLKIEEFIDPEADIVFYDRFYNWEVMAGSYLVKNTIWVQNFLEGYANFEYRLPKSFHGTDNGAIHVIMIFMSCTRKSHLSTYLFAYEACVRKLIGNMDNFKKIKILAKGTAWARDNWMTNSRWNEERDFMIHNMKLSQIPWNAGLCIFTRFTLINRFSTKKCCRELKRWQPIGAQSGL
ncbi:unnamed protein product [Heligmosomoides polygyrus]|uniref:Protein FAR1-RELATED SEQUENCE n=1 Tax=Heligmosomoides polygyrus TaxID=6339 RepID=A0A3P8ASD7_HELPZ|nr:unnamed protein product [Heligmosomoides polygyrus]